MQIILLFLFISQNLNGIQINNRQKRFVNIVKRDVHSSSLQNLNRYTKTYEIGHSIILNTPNFTLIDSLLLSSISTNRSKPSVRDYTRWLISPISLNNIYSTKSREIARYDSIQNRFILNHYKDFPCTIDANTGQLTLINPNDENLLYTELSLHAESGLSQGDEILYDIYRFIRLLTTSLNCTANVTVDIDESIEIICTIEYEFLKYDDLDNYQPTINLTFYLKQNDSLFTVIDQIYLNEIKDLREDNNITSNWKRSIIYRIKSINKGDNGREYACIVVPDTFQTKDLFQDKNRICLTRINVKNDNSSTVIFTRLNQWDLIDILITVLIVLSSLLLTVSLILCLTARQYNKKRTVQIKPETVDKSIRLPLGTKRIFSKENLFSNNNEMKSEIPLLASQQFSERSIKSVSSQHKPGCPKYIPSSEYNLLSSDLFTHTTIDNMKKIILPDIPETNDLFDDQTYVHFYVPSKNTNLSMKTFFEKNKSTD